MKLTDYERLVLLNQYRILDKLEPKSGWDRAAEAVEYGYETYIADMTRGFGTAVSAEQSKFVLDAFAVYEAMQDAVKAMGPGTTLTTGDVGFPGFDGHSELELQGYAVFIRKDGRFAHVELQGHNMDSHWRTSPVYRAMINRYKEIMGEGGMTRRNLTEPEIRELLELRG